MSSAGSWDGRTVDVVPSTEFTAGSASGSTLRLPEAFPAQWFSLQFSVVWVIHFDERSATSATLDGVPVARLRTIPLNAERDTYTLRATYAGASLDVVVRTRNGVAPSASLTASLGEPATSGSTGERREEPPRRESTAPEGSTRTRQTPPSGGSARRLATVTAAPVYVGRTGHGADVELSGLDVAVRHASFRYRRGAVEVQDLSGDRRTFVDGRAVLFEQLAPGDRCSIGGHTLFVDERNDLYERPITEPIALTCEGVGAVYRGERRAALEGVSFRLPRGAVLAVVGPSGAGKSTLCSLVVGELKNTRGVVRLGDVDLLTARDGMARLVSYVPQAEAMTAELSVRRTLRYAARLKAAQDASGRELDAKVDEVIERVGLAAKAGDRVRDLSGGQRKRVSIAMELLTDPPLIVLDEPTSGLDEGLDLRVMQLLRQVSQDGTTVIIVTHAMANIDQADTVLALAACTTQPGSDQQTGRVGYLGAPDEILAAFGTDRWSGVMLQLADGVSRASSDQGAPSPGRGVGIPLLLPKGIYYRARRLLTLSARETARLCTRPFAFLQAFVASPALALFLVSVAAPNGLTEVLPRNPRLSAGIGVLCVCIALFAMALSFSSIVGERAAIDRERRWGIRSYEVVLAKFLVLGLLATLQTAVVLILYPRIGEIPVRSLIGEPPTMAAAWVSCVLLALASVAIGLLISTFSRSLQQATGVLVSVMTVQVVLCGVFIPLGQPRPGQPPRTGYEEVASALSYLTSTRWAVALIGADLDVQRSGVPVPDALWNHEPFRVWVAALLLATFIAMALIATARLMSLQAQRRK